MPERDIQAVFILKNKAKGFVIIFLERYNGRTVNFVPI